MTWAPIFPIWSSELIQGRERATAEGSESGAALAARSSTCLFMRGKSWGAGERFKAKHGSASCMAFSSGRPPCVWPLTEELINPPARCQALDPPHHREAALWTNPARGHSPIILKVSHHKWHGRHFCPRLEKGGADGPECWELVRPPVSDQRPHLFTYTSLSRRIQTDDDTLVLFSLHQREHLTGSLRLRKFSCESFTHWLQTVVVWVAAAFLWSLKVCPTWPLTPVINEAFSSTH